MTRMRPHSLSEFEIIQSYFVPLQKNNPQTIIGIGDDAAVLNVEDIQQLCISVDTINSGVHFLEDTNAELIAYKALAVNISDMAAMGAKPDWFTLALSLPEFDEQWLHDFSKGLSVLAAEHALSLVGGDTTRGPLSITIQIAGVVSNNAVMSRAAAKVNDVIYVTGELGEASIALAILQKKLKPTETDKKVRMQKLMCPSSRASFAVELAQYANAAIDISDGLSQDLAHILKASKVGARIEKDKIPLSSYWIENGISKIHCLEYALSGGDDYELCFTLPTEHIQVVENIASRFKCKLTQIGEITAQTKLLMHDGQTAEELDAAGYDHFK